MLRKCNLSFFSFFDQSKKDIIEKERKYKGKLRVRDESPEKGEATPNHNREYQKKYKRNKNGFSQLATRYKKIIPNRR